MSTNNRIFYACQGVAIANHGTAIGSYGIDNMVHGVQSVGMTTTFNPEQAFELGQVEIYENIEGTPDVEVTLEKALDGYPLIYHMASTGVSRPNTDPTGSGLVGRSKEQCDLRLGIFDEGRNNIAGGTDNSGKAEVEVYCSGMFISSISYTIPVDGFATESVTLVGNNKRWLTGAAVAISDAMANEFDGNDEPLALGGDAPLPASGGISRREDVLFAHSIWPNSIRGVTGGAVAGNGWDGTDNYIHIQNFTVSTDFSREDIFELGRKTPYHRPAGFPIEVSCEIEAITTSGDFVFAFEDGDPDLYGTKSSGDNTSEESIFVVLRGGYQFDLGSKNRLTSVTYGGGDATGGNVSTSYSYTNFNDLDVQYSGDYIGFNFI